jgi:NADPH2:quinone reductase
LPTAGLTALRALEPGGLIVGKRVLVTGAAGGVGRTVFGLAIEHLAPGGVVVNIATQDDEESVTFRAAQFDRSHGASVRTLNLLSELGSHATVAADLSRLGRLAAAGRLDGQISLECSWRQPFTAIDALLNHHLGGKIVFRMD